MSTEKKSRKKKEDDKRGPKMQNVKNRMKELVEKGRLKELEDANEEEEDLKPIEVEFSDSSSEEEEIKKPKHKKKVEPEYTESEVSEEEPVSDKPVRIRKARKPRKPRRKVESESEYTESETSEYTEEETPKVKRNPVRASIVQAKENIVRKPPSLIRNVGPSQYENIKHLLIKK